MAERPELRLVREHLESVLSPSLAGQVLFEALGVAGGRMPKTVRDTTFLVEGPLRAVLEERLRKGEADALVADVMAALAPALASETSAPAPLRGDVTLEVPLSVAGEAVRLVVLSAEETFAVQIEGALGSSRVSAVTLRSAQALSRVLNVPVTAPEVLVVDASRFPPIEPGDLAAALDAVPDTVPRAIWGSDLPYGAAVIREVAARKGRATPFDRTEGVDPILDLVRSRAGRISGLPMPP
jgi:hypothetical protein